EQELQNIGKDMARKLVARALWATGSAELVPRLKLQSSIPSLRSESYLTRSLPPRASMLKKNPKNSRTTRLSHRPWPLRGVRFWRKREGYPPSGASARAGRWRTDPARQSASSTSRCARRSDLAKRFVSLADTSCVRLGALFREKRP